MVAHSIAWHSSSQAPDAAPKGGSREGRYLSNCSVTEDVATGNQSRKWVPVAANVINRTYIAYALCACAFLNSPSLRCRRKLHGEDIPVTAQGHCVALHCLVDAIHTCYCLSAQDSVQGTLYLSSQIYTLEEATLQQQRQRGCPKQMQ